MTRARQHARSRLSGHSARAERVLRKLNGETFFIARSGSISHMSPRSPTAALEDEEMGTPVFEKHLEPGSSPVTVRDPTNARPPAKGRPSRRSADP